jgi:hypothetical protein
MHRIAMLEKISEINKISLNTINNAINAGFDILYLLDQAYLLRNCLQYLIKFLSPCLLAGSWLYLAISIMFKTPCNKICTSITKCIILQSICSSKHMFIHVLDGTVNFVTHEISNHYFSSWMIHVIKKGIKTRKVHDIVWLQAGSHKSIHASLQVKSSVQTSVLWSWKERKGKESTHSFIEND